MDSGPEHLIPQAIDGHDKIQARSLVTENIGGVKR
jgi:hypothetical protein